MVESSRPLRVGIAVECGDGWCGVAEVGWSEFVADNDYGAAELAAILADLAEYGIVYLGGGAAVAYRLVAL